MHCDLWKFVAGRKSIKIVLNGANKSAAGWLANFKIIVEKLHTINTMIDNYKYCQRMAFILENGKYH